VPIGEGVMVGGVSGVTGNIVPFGFAKGQIAVLAGLNVVGLRRRGVTSATLHRLRKAYQSLFFGDGVFADRVDQVAGEADRRGRTNPRPTCRRESRAALGVCCRCRRSVAHAPLGGRAKA
jgi:acyl-[acyl carrier protein]--UDP-N-acetylglucosamine O-acyltransferase